MAYRLAPVKPKSPPGFYLTPELEQFRDWEIDHGEYNEDITPNYATRTRFKVAMRYAIFRIPLNTGSNLITGALWNFCHPETCVYFRQIEDDIMTVKIKWSIKQLIVKKKRK